MAQTPEAPTVIRVGERDIDLMGGETLGWLAVGMAALGLAIALVSQYGFGWAPCELCLWQRYPYYVGLGLALPALLWRVEPRWLLAGAALVFAIGCAIAFYHTLVELKVVEGLASCDASTLGAEKTLEEFLKNSGAKPIVDCSVRTPFFLGLTMTNLNLIVSGDIASLFALAAWRSKR